MNWRIELVGGPYCGHWFKYRGRLPDTREFLVSVEDEPAAIYFLETDECDSEQRASYVRSVGFTTAL